MKKIVLYSPSLASMNVGDSIITDAVKDQISDLLLNSHVMEVSTHLPTSWYYMRNFNNIDFKFVCGSNLLKATFFGFKRQWDVTIRQAGYYGPCILIGAGWWQYNNKPNLYTKILLKKILRKDIIHSVRDEFTKNMLATMGITNVINTSCPTMWKLTKEHCAKIPKCKADDVVFTLTDYNKDKINDKILIETLLNHYNVVYFWPQGLADVTYLKELGFDEEVITISPNTTEYDKLLNLDIDYIGTRLHGGIRALQKQKRTIIVSIDNRAQEKNKNFNIPIIERTGLKQLDRIIETEFSTEIEIPEENIRKWKKQFEKV